nr:enoyl-CoA hydratase [uncultured bacterium]ASV47020.1 enoyl-CoA hydratase [uncultured bacterium]
MDRMSYDSIVVTTSEHRLTVTLNRLMRQNALTDTMLAELHEALDLAEHSPSCRMIVLQGANGVFCTGMDLDEAAKDVQVAGDSPPRGAQFFSLLRRFTAIPRVVVSKVDGRVSGGGVGLVAASDFVFASERSQFSLPEALWGLLPCSVAPFLQRRIGFQGSYSMTLSTLPLNARKAERLGLVDEVAEDPGLPIQRLASRVTKLEATTIAAAKRYFARLWPITEEMEAAALRELDNLLSSASVQHAIAGFASRDRSFPWER